MQKKIFYIGLAFCLMSFSLGSNFYNMPLKSIDNGTIDLRQFSGKRIMFIILPLDTGSNKRMTPMHINALAMNRIDSLIIIGVPGEELGYNEGSKKRLKGYYANMPANFILAGITKVSKASGQRQSLLFKWLTDRRKNGLFDIDAKEAGEKFFINKYGRLYAVMGPRVSLSSPIMSRILSERGH